jgi:hypothetical protein
MLGGLGLAILGPGGGGHGRFFRERSGQQAPHRDVSSKSPVQEAGPPLASSASGRNPASSTPSPAEKPPALPVPPGVVQAEPLHLLDPWGAHFEVTRNEEGEWVAIEGSLKASVPAASGAFHSLQPDSVLRQAEAVLSDLGPLLGVPAALPLGAPQVRVGPRSAQVFYQQTYRGVPLWPSGTWRVDFGPEGQLLRLDRDRVQVLRILPEGGPSGALPGGAWGGGGGWATSVFGNAFGGPPAAQELLIWIESRGVGRWAYRTQRRGQLKIVDAQTGQVLWNQNLRRQ